MTATYLVGATTITKVWLALGGQHPKHGQASAFYRRGNNPQAVSLNDEKACWYDHRDGVGGGILDLIQRVLGSDRVGALRWLSSFTGLPLEDRATTRAERRAFVERREHELRQMQETEWFRTAAASIAEEILNELFESTSLIGTASSLERWCFRTIPNCAGPYQAWEGSTESGLTNQGSAE